MKKTKSGHSGSTLVRDRRGRSAPTLTVAEFRGDPGNAIHLAERHGAIAISLRGKALAVVVSLDEFVSLLFGIRGTRRAPGSRSRSSKKAEHMSPRKKVEKK